MMICQSSCYIVGTGIKHLFCARFTCAACADGRYQELQDRIFDANLSTGVSECQQHNCEHWTYVSSENEKSMHDSLRYLMGDLLHKMEDLLAISDAMEEHSQVHHKRSYAICEAPL